MIEKHYASATALAAGTFTPAQVGRLFKNSADGEVFRLVDTSPTFRHEFSTDQSDYDLTDGATIAVDCLNGPVQAVTLGGNRTISNPTNAAKGAQLVLRITQDGTGSRLGTFGSAFHFASGAPTLTTTAAAVDVVIATYNGANWDARIELAVATS